MREDADELLKELLRRGPDVVQARFPGARTCILATRVAIEVLRYFGFNPRPFPCAVVAMNKIAAEGFVAGKTWPEIRSVGGYSLGQLGSGMLPGPEQHWDGHLAVLIEHHLVDEQGQEGALLIDFSLKDLHRPEHGVHAAPLLATVPQRWVGPGKRLVLPLPDDGVAMYSPIDDDSWRRSPDWQRKSRWSPLAGQLIRELSARG